VEHSDGALEKFRHAPVCLPMSVRMGQLGSKWMDYHEISHFIIFRKSVQENQDLLK